MRITSSSDYNKNHLPDNLRNPGGNPWHSKGPNKEWLQYEFSTPVTFKGFRTKAPGGWDGAMFKNFKFQVSSDGRTWTTVHEGVGRNMDCCDWQETTFSSVTSRYFRLYMVDNWGYKGGKYFVIQQLDLMQSK